MTVDFFRGAVALAPMAGAADSAFRQISMEMGASFCVSEMISAKALCLGDKNTSHLLRHTDIEKPFGIQLFGYDIQDFKKAACLIERDFTPDFIDINMGCPAPKITGSGAGAALMKTPDKAADIIRAVKDSVSLPVTAKIRSGFSEKTKNAVCFSKMLEAAGVDAIIIHGRSRERMYSPPVDLQIIKDVTAAVSVPVIGNGDIRSCSDVKDMLCATSCAGVMIGRAALGNPFIFAEIKAKLSEKDYCVLELTEQLQVLRRQIETAAAEKGEYSALREARKHAAWYIKGFRGASSLRYKAGQLETMRDLDDFISLSIKSYNDSNSSSVRL